MKRTVDDFKEIPNEGKSILKEEFDENNGIYFLHQLWTWSTYMGQTIVLFTIDINDKSEFELNELVKPLLLETIIPNVPIVIKKELYTFISFNMKDFDD